MTRLQKFRYRFVALGLATIMAATGVMVLGAGTARADVRGWTTLAELNRPYAVALICKQYSSGGYGPMWRIRTAALASPGAMAEVRVQVIRRNNYGRNYVVNGSVAKTNWNGQWVSRETYASIYLNDRIRIVRNVSNGQGSGGEDWMYFSIGRIGYCGA